MQVLALGVEAAAQPGGDLESGCGFVDQDLGVAALVERLPVSGLQLADRDRGVQVVRHLGEVFDVAGKDGDGAR